VGCLSASSPAALLHGLNVHWCCGHKRSAPAPAAERQQRRLSNGLEELSQVQLMFAGIALLLQLYERGYLIPTSPTATHPARSSLTSLLSRPVLDICFVSCATAAAVTRFAASLNCVSCWHPVLLSPPTALNMPAIMEHGAVSGLRAASVRRLPVRFKHFKAQLTAAADTSCSRAVCHVAAEDTHPDIVQCCSLVGYALDQHSASVAQLLSHAHLLQSPAC